jgi:hypothetical protein
MFIIARRFFEVIDKKLIYNMTQKTRVFQNQSAWFVKTKIFEVDHFECGVNWASKLA